MFAASRFRLRFTAYGGLIGPEILQLGQYAAFSGAELLARTFYIRNPFLCPYISFAAEAGMISI